METDPQTLAWLALGGALLVSELFLPGLVAAFFGAGALTAAAARWLGLVDSTPASFAVFAGSSVAYLLVLRRLAIRWVGPPVVTRDSTSEEVRVFGAEVEVVDEVVEGVASGRIRHEGSTWPAISRAGVIPAGSRARLIHRDSIGWVVESVGEPAPPALPSLPSRRPCPVSPAFGLI